MCDLKNYDTYLMKLKRFAKINRISVVWRESASDAEWVPSKRQVKLDKELSQAEIIAAFLHELGHSMDDTLTGKHEKAISKSYDSYYANKHSRKQWQTVRHHEVEAWRFAKLIAKMVGIPLGKWFSDYKRECLRSYRFKEERARK